MVWQKGAWSPSADGSLSNAMPAQQRDERSVGRDLRHTGAELEGLIQQAERYVDSFLHCSTPAPASNRVNLLHGSHRCTHTPSRHQILQAARAWLRNNSAITAKVDISCARADACSTDDCTPLAASVIACAARLRQNRCNETHQNKSAPRGGASERSNNRASAPRGGAVAFRTNQ